MGQSKAFAGQTPDLPPTMQDGTPLAIAGMVPATDEHGKVVGAVGIEAAKHGYGKISGPGLSGKEPLTEEAFIAETKPQYNPDPLTETATGLMIACRTDGPPVTLTTDSAPQTLEDRMLVVVGSNYMNLSLVASLLKVEENAVRAVAESSDKFRVSGTGKSICKTDAL